MTGPGLPAAAPAPAALRLEGVGRSYGRVAVLRDLDLTVGEGQILAVLGASGSGKTTLLRVIVGLDRADGGTVRLDGALVDGPGPGAWVKPEDRHVGYVPQEGALFPHLTVAANVGFGVPHGRRHGRPAAVAETLAMVGLTDLAGRYPHQLSGGQRQRVALARALAVKPRLVVLDEPFSSLDAALRAGLRTEVARVLRSAGTTAVVVTHDQDEALSVADQVAVLRQGRFVQVGSPAALLAEPVDAGVARFLETGTLLTVDVVGTRAATPWGDVATCPIPPGSGGGGRATVLIRPSQVRLHATAQPGCPAAEVVAGEYRGGVSLVRVHIDGADDLLARSDGPIPVGQRVWPEVTGPLCAWAAAD